MAITRGLQTIDHREIDDRPPAEERKGGLGFGPAAPTEQSAREKLRKAVVPAFDMLVGYASGGFGRRKREQAIAAWEKPRRIKMAAQEKTEADLRYRAPVVAASFDAPPKPAPGRLQDVPGGEPPQMNQASFPGAWAITSGSDPTPVQNRLNGTSNLDLRETHRTTRDAMLFVGVSSSTTSCTPTRPTASTGWRRERSPTSCESDMAAQTMSGACSVTLPAFGKLLSRSRGACSVRDFSESGRAEAYAVHPTTSARRFAASRTGSRRPSRTC